MERARQKDGKNLENFKTTNLHVRNIDASVDHKQLKQHFKGCGEIVSVRYSRRRNGDSKGCAFVCFSTHEEANKALKTMNGKITKTLSLILSLSNYYCITNSGLCFHSGSILAGRSLTLALDRHENHRLSNSAASSSSSLFPVPVPVPQAYHHQYPSLNANFNQPFWNQYVNGVCYGPYPPPMVQNFSHRYTRAVRKSTIFFSYTRDSLFSYFSDMKEFC